MDKKEQIENAKDYLYGKKLTDSDFMDSGMIEFIALQIVEYNLSQPKEVEPKKEVDLDEFSGIENIVLLYLQENRYTFSGDSINGYPFVSEIDREFKCNLQGVLEDFADDLLNGLPHLQKPVESEWISCYEKNLPQYGSYLCCHYDNWIEICYRKFDSGMWYNEQTDEIRIPTHYKILPQPPKNDSNN